MSTLFDSFNQEFTQMIKTSGIGIGLSTAKMLTEALQGGIHLQSKEKEGTTVAFSVITASEFNSIDSSQLK